MPTDYRNFLALSYAELEELNLGAKADRAARTAADEIREKRLKYLTDEKRIKAVTVLFSDLEGRLHLLDYDKKFLLGAYENLTFDGSSIRGFQAQIALFLRREAADRRAVEGEILVGAQKKLLVIIQKVKTALEI